MIHLNKNLAVSKAFGISHAKIQFAAQICSKHSLVCK